MSTADTVEIDLGLVEELTKRETARSTRSTRAR